MSYRGLSGIYPENCTLRTISQTLSSFHPILDLTFALIPAVRFQIAPCLLFANAPLWSSPRPISDSQLRKLLPLHLCSIYLVVFKGSYFFRMGDLISRGASRLDAFSVYPVRTWLLCRAPGGATDSPAVRPSRSSRTKDSSSQISCARAG